MKLGLSYNVFEGEELLEHSIKYIRNQVDYISVVYQTESYFGGQASENLLEILNDLVSRKYIDELFGYKPNIDLSGNAEKGHLQQIDKRNIGLALSMKEGCTHHMPIDVDEFYEESQFSYMKRVVEEGNFDASACKHNQYYKDSIYMITPREEEYVATIHKINKDTKFYYNIPCVVPIDPSRKTNNTNYRIFTRNEVEMHHLSFVRKDLAKKLMCSLARNDFADKIKAITDYYNAWEYPMRAMWAAGNMLDVVKVQRLFEIYGN